MTGTVFLNIQQVWRMADSIAEERRQKRLAQQLRANLVRRKQQAREREEMREKTGHDEAEHPQGVPVK